MEQFVGQKKTVAALRTWLGQRAGGQRTQKLKMLAVVCGPPGSGKTCMTEVLCKETRLVYTHISVYNLTTETQVQNALESAAASRTIHGRVRLVVLDNINGHPTGEGRGLEGLLKFVRCYARAAFVSPVVVLCNESGHATLRKIKAHVLALNTYRHYENDMRCVLQRALRGQNILGAWSATLQSDIVRVANGDARLLLNMAEFQALGSNHAFTRHSKCDEQLNIFQTTRRILTSTNATPSSHFNTDSEMMRLMLHENYLNGAVANLEDMVTKADIFSVTDNMHSDIQGELMLGTLRPKARLAHVDVKFTKNLQFLSTMKSRRAMLSRAGTLEHMRPSDMCWGRTLELIKNNGGSNNDDIMRCIEQIKFTPTPPKQFKK